MTPRPPRVSVLMNCFNGERYLREAIDSVLAQTFADWELVFWDNRSTDASVEICRSYRDPRIKCLIAPEHTNLGGARARAAAHLSGEFVAVLDVDDVWLPDKLSRQIPCFNDPQVGIVISDTLFFTDAGAQRRLFGDRFPPQGRVFADLLASYFCSLETVVMRHAAIRALGHGFDPALSHISDFDLIVRLSHDWKLVCVPEVLAKWRVHASSGTWSEPERFYREKVEFIRKMDALPEFADAWGAARPAFVRDTHVSEAITLLARNERRRCRETAGPYRTDGLRARLVYWLSWLPFTPQLIRRYRRRKALA